MRSLYGNIFVLSKISINYSELESAGGIIREKLEHIAAIQGVPDIQGVLDLLGFLDIQGVLDIQSVLDIQGVPDERMFKIYRVF